MQGHPDTPTEADLAYIASCLGRDASGVVVAVAARDGQARPAVIANHPLRRQAGRLLPFPTMYWLIDPVWCKHAADLERGGAVGELEQAIAEDQTLRTGLHADHRMYAEARWALLTEDQRRYAVDAGFAETLRDKGIGGIADFDRLKCLHLHLAHHLAERAVGRSGTTAGRLIEGRM